MLGNYQQGQVDLVLQKIWDLLNSSWHAHIWTANSLTKKWEVCQAKGKTCWGHSCFLHKLNGLTETKSRNETHPIPHHPPRPLPTIALAWQVWVRWQFLRCPLSERISQWELSSMKYPPADGPNHLSKTKESRPWLSGGSVQFRVKGPGRICGWETKSCLRITCVCMYIYI